MPGEDRGGLGGGFPAEVRGFLLINLISFYSEINDNVGDEKVSGSCHSLP